MLKHHLQKQLRRNPTPLDGLIIRFSFSDPWYVGGLFRESRCCHCHVWTQSAHGSSKALGDAYPLLLQIGSWGRSANEVLLRKAFVSVMQGFVTESFSAKQTTSERQLAVEEAPQKLSELERSIDRPVSVRVFGPGGERCVVECLAGSTIFYVKELIEEQLYVPVKRQILAQGHHKLNDQDVLHWFPAAVVNERAVVQLTLIVPSEEEHKARTRLFWHAFDECLEHHRRNEHEEIEDAYHAISTSKQQLEGARSKEAKVPEECIKKLKMVAECAVANGLLGLFVELVAAWDRSAGTKFAEECAGVLSHAEPSREDQRPCDSCCCFYDKVRRLHVERVRRSDAEHVQLSNGSHFNLLKLPQSVDTVKKAQTLQRKAVEQEHRFKQQAVQFQLKGRQAPPCARPRRR